MKKTELRRLIREELQRLNENTFKSIGYEGKNAYFILTDDDTDVVKTIDAKTWIGSSLKDKSSDNLKKEIIGAILKKERQTNKVIDYNKWVKDTNPSFEKKLEYLIKNGFVKNITRRGIKIY